MPAAAPCFNAHSQLAVRKTPEELAHLLRMLCDVAVRAVNDSARCEWERNGKYVNKYITLRVQCCLVTAPQRARIQRIPL